MRNILFLLLFTTIICTSCGDDDDIICDQENITSILVGDWTESKIGDLGDQVTFKDDNTGTCSETSIFYFDSDLNPTVTSFSWSIDSGNSLLTVERNNGTSSEYPITVVNCDDLDLTFSDANGQPLSFSLSGI